jgi:hypothetical protein
MARRYSVVFSAVSVSAAQDLFQIIGAAGKILRIISVSLADVDTTLPTNQQLSLRCRFLPATVSNGSGGSAPTPQPFDPGDAAASFTAKANSTSKATTSGTAVVLLDDGCNIYAGYAYPFSAPPIVGPSESFVFELLSTVSGTLSMSGTCIVEETGG